MNKWVIGVAILLGLVVGAGCRDLSSDGDEHTDVATGVYILSAVEHEAPPSDEVVTAVGSAIMDGFGHSALSYRNSKNQNHVDSDSFSIDSLYRVDADRSDPGAITPDGHFMFRVRKDAGPSIWFFQREISGGTTSLVSGSYHYVGYRHVNNGPGLLTAFGTATFTGTGGFTIDAVLSNNTPELRVGSITVTSVGLVTALEGTETFAGFTDEQGHMLGWLDLELTSGPYVRMDLFIRTATGMNQASLKGTYNLGRFFQGSFNEDPGCGFGTVYFDGLGSWTMEYLDHLNQLRMDQGTYQMSANGAAVLTSATGVMHAVLSPNLDRPVLFIVDTDVASGELGFFVATGR